MEELITNGSLYMNDSLDILHLYTEGLEPLGNVTIYIRLHYTIVPKICLLLYRNGLSFGDVSDAHIGLIWFRSNRKTRYL